MNSLNKKSAFTIIETLVAIAILMVALAGPLTASFRGLSASLASKDSAIALYLTQDLIEYIKNIRDTNMKAFSSLTYDVDASWLSAINAQLYLGIGYQSLNVQSGGPCTAPNWCYLDTTKDLYADSNELNICAAGIGNKCGRLYLNTVKNHYTHDSAGGANRITPFYRRYQFKMHTPGQMYCNTDPDSGCSVKPNASFNIPTVVYTDAELIVETNWRSGTINNVLQLKSDLYAVRR